MKRNLSDDDDEEGLLPRYSRQMLLPQIGMNGQKSLQTSSVIVIGGKFFDKIFIFTSDIIN